MQSPYSGNHAVRAAVIIVHVRKTLSLCTRLQADNMSNSRLLACYLAAIVHDYEHRGVNNDFLIKTSDPLALLYNDVSPMENHHVASAFLLMSEEHYAFFPRASKRVRSGTMEGPLVYIIRSVHGRTGTGVVQLTHP